MAIFTDADAAFLDYQILQNTSVSLYRKSAYLEDDLEWLQLHGYVSHTLQTSTWTTELSMHQELEDVLSFPAHYGKNLNALRECLWDLPVLEDGGMVIVLTSYDEFVRGAGSIIFRSERTLAEVLSNVLAEASRQFLLTGRRLITLVQSNDPLMQFDHLGGVSTQWNRREWLNRDRGL